MEINTGFLTDTLKKIVEIPSPSGYTKAVIDKCEEIAGDLGYKLYRNQKGNGIIEVQGESDDNCRAVFTHVDTLGLMVRSINSDGTIKLTGIGGNILPTLDGEYCRIHIRNGGEYTGTVLSTAPASHVFPEAQTEKRDLDHLCVRLDEMVKTAEDVRKLGIETGDFISIDPKFQITKSGFVKSRYLDDKASAAGTFAVLQMLAEKKLKPKYKTYFIFSVYEEVGFGAANIPEDIKEVLAFDMGCIGLDLAGNEQSVSICPKDSGGPYDYEMTGKLIELCKEHKLDYAVDIFPFYASDATAALKGGNDIKAALIGPGVAASHGMERTHIKGLENAARLVAYYILSS